MYYLQNLILNSLELREYILGRYCADPLTFKPFSLCCCYARLLKPILGRSPKLKESIEDPFKEETWLEGVHVGLHVRVLDTIVASGM
jgi:hypothetical protein